MRKMLTILVLIFSINSNAAMTVKSVSCASGTLNPARTIAVGDIITEDFFKQIESIPFSRLNVENETVLALEVSGYADGACANNDRKTILILNLVK